jgi:hypothetical protein
MHVIKLLLAIMFFVTFAVSAWAGSQSLHSADHEEREESEQLEE